MTPEYILTKSLCREPFCGPYTQQDRLAEIDNLRWSHEYAEKGYTQPNKAILFANWNKFPRGIDDLLERAGYSVEWSDEWATCSDCNRAFRTSPDSYGWQPSHAELQGDDLCINCLMKSADEYLESLENKPRKALNIPEIDPTNYGYTQIESDFENGLHPGQTDDPKAIYDRLKATHKRLLFRIDDVGQFDIRFSVWAK